MLPSTPLVLILSLSLSTSAAIVTVTTSAPIATVSSLVSSLHANISSSYFGPIGTAVSHVSAGNSTGIFASGTGVSGAGGSKTTTKSGGVTASATKTEASSASATEASGTGSGASSSSSGMAVATGRAGMLAGAVVGAVGMLGAIVL